MARVWRSARLQAKLLARAQGSSARKAAEAKFRRHSAMAMIEARLMKSQGWMNKAGAAASGSPLAFEQEIPHHRELLFAHQHGRMAHAGELHRTRAGATASHRLQRRRFQQVGGCAA